MVDGKFVYFYHSTNLELKIKYTSKDQIDYNMIMNWVLQNQKL